MQWVIILPAESEMHNAENDFGHDTDDTGDKFISHLFLHFFISILTLLITGFLPIVNVFRLRRTLYELPVSAYLLNFLPPSMCLTVVICFICC